ncbi:hypothetical protein RSAG8_10212, partial [Rhizoctonia solani AG-8 WAC10335]
MPFNATFTCSHCMDLVYCSAGCLMADWKYAWQSPHRSVCKYQAQQRPEIRKRYHRIMQMPKSIRHGVYRAKGRGPSLG